MQDNLNINQINTTNNPTDAPIIIKTDEGASDGQNKCPKCGATDISTNTNNGYLRCNFCRYEFEPEKVVGLESDISKLSGQIMGSGTQDIIADTKDVLTFKCSSCGAEVVIDTNESTQARCHWCRNTLSVNQQIPNGSIPDVVLPFNVSKDVAKTEIEKFVGKRKFFAHPKFKQEFTTENIMGVFFPYMIVDINGHSKLVGQGEKLVRTYTRGSNDNKQTYYDADLYDVEREFDITIEGLTVESSSDKLNKTSSEKTNNVINAIMPFDIENCVKWNSNYLKGYTSEKRDTNVESLKELVNVQSKDIARFKANDSLKEYNRGVRWDNEQLDIKGEQWKAAYLPVWLYSYQQIKGEKKLLHYVAVNARTKETMGSVPIHMPKLLLMSGIIEIFGIILTILTANSDSEYNWLFLLSGIVFYFIIYLRYRNTNARHKHEKETKTTLNNLREYDNYIQRLTGLRNSTMSGANNKNVSGQTASLSFVNNLIGSEADDVIKKVTGVDVSNKKNATKKGLIIILSIIIGFILLMLIISGISKTIMKNNIESQYQDILNDYNNIIDETDSIINDIRDEDSEEKDNNLEEEEPFLLAIEDVFSITGKGTTVTGTVLRGNIKTGDKVQIVGLKNEIISTTISEITSLRVTITSANKGDNVALSFSDITREQIERGQVIAAPNSISNVTKFEAEVYLLTQEEGGRKEPIYSSYSPQFYFRTADITGTIELPEGIEMMTGGDKKTLTITLISPVAIEIGTEFNIREGGRIVGKGTVTKIIEESKAEN